MLLVLEIKDLLGVLNIMLQKRKGIALAFLFFASFFTVQTIEANENIYTVGQEEAYRGQDTILVDKNHDMWDVYHIWQYGAELTEVTKLILETEDSFYVDTVKEMLPNLSEIQVPEGNKKYASKDGVLFDKAGTRLIAYPPKGKTSYTVPEGTEVIVANAFRGTMIQQVTMAKSMKKILGSSFEETPLNRVTMYPNSITYIGGGAFYKTNLTEVTIPEGVTRLGDGAFQNTKLTSVTLPSTLKTIGAAALGDTKLTSVTLPAALKSLDKRAFVGTPVKTIKLSSKNKTYTVYQNVLYNKAKTELIYWPEGYTVSKMTFPTTLKALDVSMISNVLADELVISKGLCEISNCRYNQFKKVSVASGNKYFAAKGNALYTKDMVRLLLYPRKSPAKNVVLAEGLQILNMNVFGHSDNNIVTLTLPKSLRRIESHYTYPSIPCDGFNKLTTIKVKSGNKYFKAQDGILYNKDMTKIYWFPINKNIKNYTVPPTVTEIRNASLAKQNYLETLTISAKCTSVDQQYLGECGAQYNFYLGLECPKLRAINFKSTKAGFRSANGVVYSKGWETIWYYPVAKRDTEFTIDERCKYLAINLRNKYLEKLTLSEEYQNSDDYDEDRKYKGFTNLKEIVVPESNEKYKTVDGVVYSKGKTVEMVAYPYGKKNANLVIPADFTGSYILSIAKQPGYVKTVAVEEGSTNYYVEGTKLYKSDGKLVCDFSKSAD